MISFKIRNDVMNLEKILQNDSCAKHVDLDYNFG